MNTYLKKKNYLWQKIATGLVCLILLIGILNIFQQPIKNSFYYITSPVSKTFWKAGESFNGLFASLFQFQGLKQENDNLKQENQNLLSQVTSLQDTIKADQAIKDVIANTQSDNFTLAIVGTIGLDATGDFLLINKGSNDGISENMPVISSTKVLYGKIYKVYKNYSQVMLISNKQSVVDVKIQNADVTLPVISGAVKGNGNLSVYLDLVSNDAKINPQDVLVTSGLEGIFPKDLLIGKIVRSDKNDLKPFQTAQVQPSFDVKSIDSLFVITDYKR